jgi:hypothetical protein
MRRTCKKSLFTAFTLVLSFSAADINAFSPEDESQIERAILLYSNGNYSKSEYIINRLLENDETAFNQNGKALKLKGLLDLRAGRNGYTYLEKSSIIARDPILSYITGLNKFTSPRHSEARESLADSVIDPGPSQPRNPQLKKRPDMPDTFPFYCPSGDPVKDDLLEKKILDSGFKNPFMASYFWNYAPGPLESDFAILMAGLPSGSAFSDSEVNSSPFFTSGLRSILKDPDQNSSYTECLDNLYQRRRDPGRILKDESYRNYFKYILKIRTDRIADTLSLHTYAEHLIENGRPLEALHTLRLALEKSGFYTWKISADKAAVLRRSLPLLVSLKSAYTSLKRSKDALSIEKLLYYCELETARIQGNITSYKEVNAWTPFQNAEEALLFTASENLKNRESLLYLIQNSQEKSEYEKALERADQDRNLIEMTDIYKNYR